MDQKTRDLLSAPFSLEEIDFLPGATTQDKKKALAMPFADVRSYQERLDSVFGPDGWSTHVEQVGERAVSCELQIRLPDAGNKDMPYHYVVKSDVGECHRKKRKKQGDQWVEDGYEDNIYTSAYGQAFKRACTALGIGRYLYDKSLQIWADYDSQKRKFINPDRLRKEMFAHLPGKGIDQPKYEKILDALGKFEDEKTGQFLLNKAHEEGPTEEQAQRINFVYKARCEHILKAEGAAA